MFRFAFILFLLALQQCEYSANHRSLNIWQLDPLQLPFPVLSLQNCCILHCQDYFLAVREDMLIKLKVDRICF